MNPKIVIPIVIVAILATAGVMSFSGKDTPPKPVEINGVFTAIDIATNKATFKFRHPQDGKMKELNEVIPADCVITLNGKPTDMSMLQVGDEAHVKAEYHKKTKLIVPLEIAVERAVLAAPDSKDDPTSFKEGKSGANPGDDPAAIDDE